MRAKPENKLLQVSWKQLHIMLVNPNSAQSYALLHEVVQGQYVLTGPCLDSHIWGVWVDKLTFPYFDHLSCWRKKNGRLPLTQHCWNFAALFANSAPFLMNQEETRRLEVPSPHLSLLPHHLKQQPFCLADHDGCCCCYNWGYPSGYWDYFQSLDQRIHKKTNKQNYLQLKLTAQEHLREKSTLMLPKLNAMFIPFKAFLKGAIESFYSLSPDSR